jgi:3-mercaptopyruvate sulfurtransferase SseA
MFHWRKFSLLAGLALTATLILGGCGTDSYEEPKSGVISNAALPDHATNALIEPETLLEWMEAGLVNSTDSFQTGNVVILDYGSSNTYLPVPGAGRVATAELAATRLEGIAETGTMVPTGAMMDSVIQRLGIDDNTTIVFTSDTPFYATRAYYIFRYWGFPKEKLKVLNGGNKIWNDVINDPALMTNVKVNPTPATSNYSVRDNGILRDDLRMSIGEMITEVVPALEQGTMSHLDALGPAHAEGTGSTTDLIDPTKYVVFEGRIKGSAPLNQGDLYAASTPSRFKPAADIRVLFEKAGWQMGQPTTVACRAGVSCTTLFFALDAILNSPVYSYDGSWGQWGLYSNSVDTNGSKIPSTLTEKLALWATDQYTISGTVARDADGYVVKENLQLGNLPVYNVGRTLPVSGVSTTLTKIHIAPLRIDTTALYGTEGPADPRANQIENADRKYMTAPPAGGAPGANTGSAGGGC